MKMDENLNKIFNLNPIEPLKKETLLPAVAPENVEKREDDFELARNTMRNMVMKNEGVIEDLIDLARNSESPRAFEVVGKLVEAQTNLAKGLMDLHKQKKDVDGEAAESQNIKQQNNIVFAGSTADLMKLISAERAKTIDSR